jgi:hypothetical protein
MVRCFMFFLLWMFTMGGTSCSVVRDHPRPKEDAGSDYELVLRIQGSQAAAVQNMIASVQPYNEWVWLEYDGDSNTVKVKYRNLSLPNFHRLLHQLSAGPGVLILETRVVNP